MSECCFCYVLGVEEIVVVLVVKYGVDEVKVSIVVLMYDYVKECLNDEFELIICWDGFDLVLLNYGNEIWYGLVGVDIV